MNPFNALASYFRGVVAEVRKVTWPSVGTLFRYFFSVVVGVALGITLIWALDYLFISILHLIIK
jgi:preprotein translocase SecE subunit